MRDPLEELHRAWREVEPPPFVRGSAPAADEHAVAFLRGHYRAALPERRLTPPQRVRRIPAAGLLLSAAAVIGALSLIRTPRPAPGPTAVDASRATLVQADEGAIVLRSGRVRVILVPPPARATHRIPEPSNQTDSR